MTPEEYKRAGELFDQLRELPERERPAALNAACETDPELRAQIELLLEGDREAASGSFLKGHAIEDAARLLAPEAPNLPPSGTVVGHYRLGARIGAGGMGVVYEAEDLHLPRRVAVKVLPIPSAAQSKQRIQRFQRESRAASQLNHPHIVSIFDADCDQGCYYIAMEFVEGRTLRALIAADARFIDSKTVLEIVSQTASALSAAHQAGIVHRDIKPENIMVRPDGFVKVLDFGLATMLEPTSSSGESDLRTRPGHLAGTIQYLSPEQVLGKPAGPRSDLFSLGVVAYELATGVRPFEGPTDGAIFDAILHRDPEAPSAVRPSLGSELDGLITGLLEKDPDLRYQTAGDLRSACKRVGRTSTPASAVPLPAVGRPRTSSKPFVSTRSAGPWRSPLHIAAVVLVATVGAVSVWVTRPLPAPRVTRIRPIISNTELIYQFVNDGTRLYYAEGRENPAERMLEVSVKGGEPVLMPRLAGMFPLDISADNSEMLLAQYLEGTTNGPYPIWVASTLGSTPRRLGDLIANYARWSPNGDEILYSTGPDLRIARSDGSGSRTVTTVKGLAQSPAWSPDGRSVRFTLLAGNSQAVWEIAPDGTGLRALMPEWTDRPHSEGVWTPDGKYFVLVVRQITSDLWAIPESKSFFKRRKGAPEQLTAGPMNASHPQVSPDGQHIFFRGDLNLGELVRYDAKLDEWTPYLGGMAALYLDYSRDGKWIAYAGYPEGSVWRARSDGSERRQLTAPPLRAVNPRWSPDSRQIAFFGSLPGKQSRIYVVPARGGAVRQLSHGEAGPGGDVDATWSPDGASLVFGSGSTDGAAAFVLESLNLRTQQIEGLPGSEGLWSPEWSPDGRYIAALGHPKFKLWLYDVGAHSQTELTSFGVGWPSWSRDGRYIYFEDNATTNWYRLQVKDQKLERLASLTGLKMARSGLGWIGLTPDGSLISTRDTGTSAIYALDWETP